MSADDWINETELYSTPERYGRGLGGSQTVTDPFPERPKGMHSTTYNLLKTKVEELDLKWDPAGIWRASK